MKILLVGAYSNGNIGNSYQAKTVKSHLKRHVPNAEFFSASFSKASFSYEFDKDKMIERSSLMNTDFVNSFDMLLIAGGGLFSSKNHPLSDLAWVDKINIPVHILSVGASESGVKSCEAILRKATSVSARDLYSFQSLKRIVPSVSLVSDPILADFYNYPIPKSPINNNNKRICWIPRKFTKKNTNQVVAIANLVRAGDSIFSNFPATDRESGFDDIFGDFVTYSHSIDVLLSKIRKSSLVVSARYYGCVFGIRCGVRTVGLMEKESDQNSKIFQLYQSLNCEKSAFQLKDSISREELFNDAERDYDFFKMRENIIQVEIAFSSQMSALIKSVGC